jgi:hypothetical protein
MRNQNIILTTILFVLAWFALASVPNAFGVVPPPDGGYPGGNTAEGDNALLNVNTAIGINNTAVGANALRDDTTGFYNVAVGSGALAGNTVGQQNTAIGAGALSESDASFNSAVGFRALFMNTTGFHLTGIGAAALRNNTVASDNTAIGTDALRNNTVGPNNTAVGSSALSSNTDGFGNTANGTFALLSNTTGGDNTAIGDNTLRNNTGGANTANGAEALLNNTVGNDNTALGFIALSQNTIGNNNTAIGDRALLLNNTGDNNVAFGYLAGHNATTGSNNVYIGANMQGVAAEHNACYIASIFGQTSASGIPVLINADNKLGTNTSSKRFKDSIKPMDKASEAILALKPVTFRYKKEIDPKGAPQFGLVAEDVEKVNPDLVVRDKEGKPYTVRYDQVNAMLLNEFLKEHGKVEKLEAIIAQQHKDFEAALTDLKGQIQKVSAQLEVSKPAPQTVLNNQ